MEDEHTTRSSATSNNTKPTASKSEVISSAKVIIDAAKSAFANDNEKIDKAKVADAAADILGATNHYGKLEDKSYGKMINKAEDYLHHYNSSHSPVANAATAHNADGKEHGGGKKEHGGGGGYGEYVKMAQGLMGKGEHDGVHGHASHHGGGGGNGEHVKNNAHYDDHVKKNDMHHGGGGGGGGGYGEYVKMAQGFVSKHEDKSGNNDGKHGHSSGGGGGGEYVKFAQGILKK